MSELDVQTFGYKTPGAYKAMLANGYAVIDCRMLPNPWSRPELRELSGDDPKIFQYLFQKDPIAVEEILQQADATKVNKIAFGCYGGIHRSVAMASEFKRRHMT